MTYIKNNNNILFYFFFKCFIFNIYSRYIIQQACNTKTVQRGSILLRMADATDFTRQVLSLPYRSCMNDDRLWLGAGDC